jgi:two-component sensor histidine kinase
MKRSIKAAGKILAVDELEEHLQLLSYMLKQVMPRVTFLEALSGKQGVDVAVKEAPDVILLDMHPPRIDGLKLCRLLKNNKITRHIPVILFTGLKTDSRFRLAALESGADAFLAKPIDPAELIVQVRAMLRIKKAEDRLRKKGRRINRLKPAITEPGNGEEKWKKALKEKETLMREIHHRVKNDLSMVASLLNIQGSCIKDREARDAFAESRRRIASIARIHEKLCGSRDLINIEVGHYITDLTAGLLQSYSIPEEFVQLNLDVREIHFNAETSVPIGLIITELFTNSLKYGFPKDKKLIVTICLKPEGEYFHLVVGDNGKGIPRHIDWRNAETLGIQLVVQLTEQLDGKIELERKEGTWFHITFPRPGAELLRENIMAA